VSDLLGPMGSDCPTKRDYNARLLLKMIRSGWIMPPDKLVQVRESLEDVAIHSPDDRARIAAANVLLNAEITFGQSQGEQGEIADYSETPEPDRPHRAIAAGIRVVPTPGNAEIPVAPATPSTVPRPT